MVYLDYYLAQNPFFLIGSFLLGFVLPYIIFHHIKETTNNTLLTLALASFAFGTIFQFQDVLFKIVPLQASLFYLGFWAAIFLAIIKTGAKATGKIINKLDNFIKKEIKVAKNIKKEIKEEEKLLKEESKFVSIIKKKVNKAVDYFKKGSIRNALREVEGAIEIVDKTFDILEKIARMEKEEIIRIRAEEMLERKEFNVDNLLGHFFKNIGKVLQNINVKEERTAELMEKYSKMELREISNLISDLQSLKKILHTLYTGMRTGNIDLIKVSLYHLKKQLQEIEELYSELLKEIKIEEKLEKELEKLLKEEEKEERYINKIMKKFRKLPRL